METPRFYGHSPKPQEGGWRNKGEPNGAVLTLGSQAKDARSRPCRRPAGPGNYWGLYELL